MILQNSADIKTEYFTDRNGDVVQVDVQYEKYTINPNGLVQLRNLPSPTNTVFTITRKDGLNTIKYNNVEVLADQYDFTVDYINGVLTFHSSQKGKEVQISYTNSIGRLSISAERIFARTENQGEVVETLQNILDDGKEVLKGLRVLGDAKVIIEQTQINTDSIRELAGKVSEGNYIKEELGVLNAFAKETNDTLNSTARNASNKLLKINEWVESHVDIVNLDNRVDTVESELSVVGTQLEQIAVSIRKYSQYVTSSGDWRPAFNKALSENNSIYVPSGEYKTSKIDVPSGKTIYGNGDSTVLIPLGTSVFSSIGTLGDEIPISADISDFSNTISANNTLAKNDYILLRGVKDSLNEADSGEDWCLGYGTSGDSLFFGEFLEVESATTTQITTKSATIFPYYFKNRVSTDTSTVVRANTTIQKVNFVRDITIKDLCIKGVCNPAIRIDFGYNINIYNIKHNSDGYTDGMTGLVTLKSCLECLVERCEFKINHIIAPTEHYYVNVYRITSSQDCSFDKCKAFNTAQAFDISYVGYLIPSINSSIRSCYSKNAQQTGMTTHQGSYMAIIDGNTIVGSKQGIYCRTRNSIITNNKIINTTNLSSTSYGIGMGESNTTNCVISNNTIANATTGIYITDGTGFDSYYKYAGILISQNTINNFITGIRVNKNEAFSKAPMFIDIIDNKLYSTRKSDTNLRGVSIGRGANEITIKGNNISLITPTTLTYGVYMDYDVDNARVLDNKLRACKIGVYHRRVADLPRVNIYDTNNVYYGCETNDNLTISTVKRHNNNYVSYMSLNTVGSTLNTPETNCLFLYEDGKLMYKDNSGVLKTIVVT